VSSGVVLLDVDGTLLDTNFLHTVAWARALRRHDIVVPMARILPLIGMGADRLATELLGHGVEDIDKTHHDEFERLRPEVRVLPGAQQLVRALHDRGALVVLSSSAREDELEFFRSLLDVDDCLAAATSSDDAEQSKPDPEIFTAALERLDASPDRAMVVGDTVWDVKAAADAGMATVAVLSGGIHRAELEAAGAAAVYADCADILDHLDAGPLAKLLS